MFLSLRQYLAAVLGWRAARIEEAALYSSVFFATDGEAPERARRAALGHRTPSKQTGLDQYQAMKQRRGWA